MGVLDTETEFCKHLESQPGKPLKVASWGGIVMCHEAFDSSYNRIQWWFIGFVQNGSNVEVHYQLADTDRETNPKKFTLLGEIYPTYEEPYCLSDDPTLKDRRVRVVNMSSRTGFLMLAYKGPKADTAAQKDAHRLRHAVYKARGWCPANCFACRSGGRRLSNAQRLTARMARATAHWQ